MNNIFFNIDGAFPQVAQQVFSALDFDQAIEGDSANTLSGIYFANSRSGVAFRLEENCYDYEEDYDYMLSVKEDWVKGMNVEEEVVDELALATAQSLAERFNIEVSIEGRDGLLKTVM